MTAEAGRPAPTGLTVKANGPAAIGVPAGHSAGSTKVRLRFPSVSVVPVAKGTLITFPRYNSTGVLTGKSMPLTVTVVSAPPDVGVSTSEGVRLGVDVRVAVGVTVGVAVGVSVAAGVTGVSVGVGVAVGVWVAVGVTGVWVGVGVWVAVGVFVGVGLNCSHQNLASAIPLFS